LNIRSNLITLNLRKPESMKITEDVRRYAAEQGMAEEEAVKRGLKEKAAEFAKAGEVYQKV
jgi:phosphomethylpyrimidine synthase